MGNENYLRKTVTRARKSFTLSVGFCQWGHTQLAQNHWNWVEKKNQNRLIKMLFDKQRRRFEKHQFSTTSTFLSHTSVEKSCEEFCWVLVLQPSTLREETFLTRNVGKCLEQKKVRSNLKIFWKDISIRLTKQGLELSKYQLDWKHIEGFHRPSQSRVQFARNNRFITRKLNIVTSKKRKTKGKIWGGSKSDKTSSFSRSCDIANKFSWWANDSDHGSGTTEIIIEYQISFSKNWSDKNEWKWWLWFTLR